MNAKRPVCAAPAVQTPAPAASQSYQFCTLEHTEVASTALAEEVALAIAYNDISQAVMLVTPTDLEDFIVGFSIGSGIIADASDIYDLKLSGTGSAQYAAGADFQPRVLEPQAAAPPTGRHQRLRAVRRGSGGTGPARP